MERKHVELGRQVRKKQIRSIGRKQRIHTYRNSLHEDKQRRKGKKVGSTFVSYIAFASAALVGHCISHT